MYLLCRVVVNMIYKAEIFRYYVRIIFIYRIFVYMVNANSFAIEKFRSICVCVFALFLFVNILYYFIIVLIYLLCYLSFAISISIGKYSNPER